MRSKKKIIITVLACIILCLLAYFSWKIPFYEFRTMNLDTGLGKLFSVDYLKTLFPFLIIVALAAVGIVLCIWLRKLVIRFDKDNSRFTAAHTAKPKGVAPKQKTAVFMVIRWTVMIAFAFIMIFGSLIFGLKMSSLSLPLLSCPLNS